MAKNAILRQQNTLSQTKAKGHNATVKPFLVYRLKKKFMTEEVNYSWIPNRMSTDTFRNEYVTNNIQSNTIIWME